MVNPPVPPVAAVKSAPLSMLEIDGNMKAISDAFESTDSHFDQIASTIETLAPKDGPQFTKYIQLPLVSNGTFPSSPTEGMMVYDVSTKSIQVYLGTKDADGNKLGWQPLATAIAMNQYVKATGDIMTGKLEGTTAEFRDRVKVLPPDASIGEPTDAVATVGWVKNQAKVIVEQRLNDSGDINVQQGDVTINQGDITVQSGNINVNNGVVISNRLYGHLDMGDIDSGDMMVEDVFSPGSSPITGDYITSAQAVELIKKHTSTSGYKITTETVTSAAYYVDYVMYSIFNLTLSASRTAIQLATTSPVDDRAIQIQLYLKQGTGGNTVTWPSNISFADGQSPVLSTVKDRIDIVQLTSLDGGETWFGSQLDSWV